jgi:hypothetical protein
MLTSLVIPCPRCLVCGKQNVLSVPKDGFDAWTAGAFIQDAFPNMPVDERELLLTGTCAPCWDTLWSEDEK